MSKNRALGEKRGWSGQRAMEIATVDQFDSIIAKRLLVMRIARKAPREVPAAQEGSFDAGPAAPVAADTGAQHDDFVVIRSTHFDSFRCERPEARGAPSRDRAEGAWGRGIRPIGSATKTTAGTTNCVVEDAIGSRRTMGDQNHDNIAIRLFHVKHPLFADAEALKDFTQDIFHIYAPNQ